MRLYSTSSKPHCLVLEETGFHLVFLPTHSRFNEPSVGVAVYPPGQDYPFGEQGVVQVAGCLGILRHEDSKLLKSRVVLDAHKDLLPSENLLIVLDLPLESVGLEEECRRIKKVSFFDLDECRSISLDVSPLDHVLEAGNYYISKMFDLTKRVEDRISDDLQREEACQPKSRNDTSTPTPPCPHHFGLPRYVWNTHLLQPLFDLREKLDPKEKAWFDSRSFALPIIEGYYEQQRIELGNGERMTLTVVSRHGRERDGTRFEKRGVDSNGNVGQFVETETILETATKTISFVQVRGSVPLYWSESPSATSVDVKVAQPVTRSLSPFLLHFRTLVARFGRVHAFSLLHSHDTHRPHPEQPLSDAYEQLSNLAQNEPDLSGRTFTQQQHSINHTRFPDIPHGIVEAVSSLIDSVGIMTASVEEGTGKLRFEKKQNGIFRVNCRDCCDRTTLGQWSIAVEAMRRKMLKLGFNVEAQEKVEGALGELWANNGDAVSEIYTGANALFTRFIRTGHYSPGQQAFDNFEAMEKRNVQHYTRDHAKNRAMEILTGEYKGQEKPPKLLLISHPSHPLLPAPVRPSSSSQPQLSVSSVHTIIDDDSSLSASPSLSDDELSSKVYFQKQKSLFSYSA
ncbi:uncharacterized protein JCM6883_004962 [Sporobolomyces salmoneus]|uniref:uncharacterized protein n=1 Tax=Sporobolomyces salmoneus TaxID=183962 RepID=UPI00316F16EB